MSKTTLYNPRIPYVAHIPGCFSPGKMIKVCGFVPHLSEKFAINIQCGSGTNPRDDIAFHIKVGFKEKCIIRNHLQGMCWGIEDSGGGLPILTGKPFVVMIYCEENSFKLAINGKHFCEFPHRLPTRLASHIAIDGDITLTIVQFNGKNRGDRSIYSNVEESSSTTRMEGVEESSVDDLHGKNIIKNKSKFHNKQEKSIEISVIEPRLVSEGLKATYIIFKIITSSNMAMFPKQECSVSRRFSDFLSLHNILQEKYAKKGIIVPPAPEKFASADTRAKITEDITSSHLIKKRQAFLNRFINRIAQHPVLRLDSNFRQFLTADFDIPRPLSILSVSSTSFFQFFNKMRSIELLYKTEENDDWYAKSYKKLEAFNTALTNLSEVADTFSEGRRELATVAESFSESITKLSSLENDSELNFSLFHLKNAQNKVANLNNKQSDTDIYQLCELFKDYLRYIDVIKEVFHERVMSYQQWQNLKLKSDNVSEHEQEVEVAFKEFTSISDTIKTEMETFEKIRVKEFGNAVNQYLKNQLSHQKQFINCLKFIVPENERIDRCHVYPKYKQD